MSFPFDFPALPPSPPDLPETLRDIVTKLRSFGFTLEKKNDAWILYFPSEHWSGSVQIQFNDNNLANGLLQILRNEETQNDVLHRYEQFDQKWGKVVYGNSKSDTTIAQAGCGPTSLAIVLHYLMSNGSRPHDACYADDLNPFGNDVTPLETARYAASVKARVSGHGTAGKPMVKHIQEWWPEFDGVEVKLDEAAFLLQEGKLIIFLCKHCSGYNKAPLPRIQPEVTYKGHYMVLAGIEGHNAADQIFYVVDPGRRISRAMRFIKRKELEHHAAGFWWVFRKGEEARRVCQ